MCLIAHECNFPFVRGRISSFKSYIVSKFKSSAFQKHFVFLSGEDGGVGAESCVEVAVYLYQSLQKDQQVAKCDTTGRLLDFDA